MNQNNAPWNSKIYSGGLSQYQYPSDKEFGTLLSFLKQIDPARAARIHITDVCDWRMPMVDSTYDIYIVCAFGEFVNEDYCHKLDSELSDRKLILLTSQYYAPCDLKNFTVFTIEHLHTAARFFEQKSYLPLNQRPYRHATQSRHNALHKSLITAELLRHFPDLQYTFCNRGSTEYSLDTLSEDLQKILAIACTAEQQAAVAALHNNPREIPGDDWDITQNYTQSQLFWVTESIFLSRRSCPTAYLTEKTLKPIVTGCAWIVCGQQHSYRRIRELGFETFESEFEIDFDDLGDKERLAAIYERMTLDFDNIITKVDTQEKINYNYNHFFGNFVQYVEKQNQPRIQNFIDYVNSI